ncbi:hypothetical protein PG985_011562 [Apiospora marii]|uniref:Fungal N-terminal domain-containing protein n=1 Tax=Apiospora marii TaxID=335849 RepID=A0ABR1R0U1_9PEZI
MDPLSALAIAAAVVQFAEIGGQLMVKGWHRYRRHSQKTKDDEREGEGEMTQEPEEREIEAFINELTLFTRTVRESTDRVVPNLSPGPAEGQLLRLCEECESIAADLQDVLTKIKKRPAKNFQDPTGRGDKKTRGWAGANVKSAEDRLKEIDKSMDWDRRVLAGLWTSSKIEKMQLRLNALRQSTMSTILLCLW